MISKKIQDAFNEQINAETYSAYMYWSMSAALERMNIPGFASWMRVQAQEEMTHAMKFYSHIIERDGKVELTAIEAPPIEWASVKAVFEAGLKHEQLVTGLINGLVDLATVEKDHAGNMFLRGIDNSRIGHILTPLSWATGQKSREAKAYLNQPYCWRQAFVKMGLVG